jgi:hypothetical protein
MIVFFYSGGFLDPSSLPGLWLTFRDWVATGTAGASGHEKPYGYWVELMARYEMPALFGLISACWIGALEPRRPLRLLAIWSCGVLTAYGIVKYKTPWCLISITWPFYFLFATGIAWLARRVDRWLAGAVAVVTLGHSLHNSFLLNFRNYANETEPYVYVQTLPSIHRLLDPLRALVARDPINIHLKGNLLFATGDAHPLPWLLADYTGVTFLDEKTERSDVDADFLLIANPFVSDIQERLKDTYFRETITLRGNSGEQQVLFLRAKTFGCLFPERTPEFLPFADTEKSEEKKAKLIEEEEVKP